MGILKNALQKAIKKQIKQRFNPVSKSKRTNSQNATRSLRELREKQEIADNIRKHAKFQSQQHMKVVQDCVTLVNTTVNPEVFFMRYNLMLEHLEILAGLECTGIFDNSPELPSVAFQRIEERFDTETNTFLKRSFDKAKAHADTLKTDNGKKNAIKRYFDNMEKYTHHMSGESMEYFYKMKDTNLPKGD